MIGRLDEAEEQQRQALAIGESARLPNARTLFGYQRFYLRRDQGHSAELIDSIEGLAQRLPLFPLWRCMLAAIYLDVGRHHDAEAEIAPLARHGFADIRRDGLWLLAMALSSEVCAGLGDAPAAETLYELLRPAAAHHIVAPSASVYVGPVAYYLALLAVALQRREVAAAHFQSAIESTTRLGAVLLRAKAQAACAPMLGSPAVQGGEVPAPAAEVSAETSVPSASAAIFRRDGDFWTVGYEGSVMRLKDARGVFYLAHLLRYPGREMHAMDLVAAARGGAPAARATRIADASELERRAAGQGDAGAVLDAQAKAAYRQHLRELKEELEEAQEFNDLGRVERLQEEIELIARELSAAVGLGGRDRVAASDAERARVAVTKAISLALKAIANGNPALHRYFGRTIKTGRVCVYDPEAAAPVRWQL